MLSPRFVEQVPPSRQQHEVREEEIAGVGVGVGVGEGGDGKWGGWLGRGLGGGGGGGRKSWKWEWRRLERRELDVLKVSLTPYLLRGEIGWSGRSRENRKEDTRREEKRNLTRRFFLSFLFFSLCGSGFQQCAVAYFLASLFTFIPTLNAFLPTPTNAQ